MFKKIITLIVSFILLFTIFADKEIKSQPVANTVNIYYFEVSNCGNCAAEKVYLTQLEAEFPNIVVHKFNIANLENEELLVKVRTAFNETVGGVPFTALGGKHYVGFNDNVKVYLRKYIEKYSYNDHVDVVNKIINDEEILESDFDLTQDVEFDLPFFGRINVKNVSLLLISIVIGLIDGFNPCAMWVLIFLITMLISTKDRKKMWILGGVFLLTSAVIYFTMMLAWLEIIKIIANKFWFQLFIGIFAIVAGLYQLYRYTKSIKKSEVGCEVTNEQQKRKLFTKIKSIVTEKSFLIGIIGIIIVAISVNFIELACSAGLPVLYSQILLINEVSRFQSIMYTLVYILFFLIDDIVIFVIAMVTLRVTGISNKYSKYSHLIGGIVMFLIGFLMLFFPDIIMFNF